MAGGSQNTQSAQGGIPGLLAKAPDPLGLSNGGGALDPFNLMGSPALPPGAPSKLPNLGINPTFYSSNTFAPRAMNGGTFNNEAARLAGPQYMPRVMGGNVKTGMPVMRGNLGPMQEGGGQMRAGAAGSGLAGLSALLQALQSRGSNTFGSAF